MTSLPPFPLKICHYDYGKETALQTHLCCASLAKNAALCELSYPAALLPIAKSWKSLEKVLIAQLSWLIYISHLQRTELSGSPADMFPAKSAYHSSHTISFLLKLKSCPITSTVLAPFSPPSSFVLLKRGESNLCALVSASSCLPRFLYHQFLPVTEAPLLRCSCTVASVIKKKWGLDLPGIRQLYRPPRFALRTLIG